jgi:hypothetical protein
MLITMDLKRDTMGRADWSHPMAGCEHGNEISGSIKGGRFLHYMSERMLTSEEGLCFME